MTKVTVIETDARGNKTVEVKLIGVGMQDSGTMRALIFESVIRNAMWTRAKAFGCPASEVL